MDSHLDNTTYRDQTQESVPDNAPRWQVIEREELASGRQQPPQRGKRGWRVVLALLVVVTVAGLCMLQYHRMKKGADGQMQAPFDLDAFTLTATAQDADGIAPDTGFTLSTSQPATKEQVQSLLLAEPTIEFTVEQLKIEDGDADQPVVFAISPKEKLRGNTVYNLYLSQGDARRSFAFQTKTTFALAHFMPQGAVVPVDSGIELGFVGGNPEALEQSFSISPALEGHFERIRDSYVYVHEGMQADTYYTVTLDGDLKSEGGMQLEQPVTYSFRTSSYREDGLYPPWRSSQCSTVLPDRVPAIFCYPSNAAYGLDYEVTVYRFHDQAGYLDALRTLYAYEKELGDAGCTFSTDQATPVLTFTDSLKKAEDYGAHLVLPDTLEEGYYLIKAACEQPGCSMEQLLQVSDIATYLIAGEGKLAVWVNSAATGEPLVGVTVMQDGYSKGVTDENGLAVIETPHTDTRENFSYLAIDVGTTPYLLDSMAWPQPEQTDVQRKYYMALYTDRSVYLPEDTVHFWGVVQPRIGSMGPKKVALKLCAWNARGESYSALDETELTVGDFGVFSGAFALEDFAYGYYSIVADIEGEEVFLGSINVENYQKPIYLLDISSENRAFDIAQPATISLHASFYDGTPARGLALESGYSDRDNRYVSEQLDPTDQQGNTVYTLSIPDQGSEWRPFSLYLNVSNAQAEDAYLYTSHEMVFLPRNRMLEAKPDGDRRGLTYSLHEIDATAFEGETPADAWDYDAFRGAVVDGELSCAIKALNWHRTLEGTRYDYIEKKMVNTYSYYTTEEMLGQVTLQTQGGQAHLDLSSYDIGEDSYFVIEASTTDSAGRAMAETVELYPNAGSWGSQSDAYVHYLFETNGQNSFVAGESVPLTLTRIGGADAHNAPQGRVLLAPVTDNLHDFAVQSADAIAMDFTQEHIPNVWIYGAYFDGRDIYPVSPAHLTYRASERELTVTVTPDKEGYTPGDKVTLDVAVADAQGNPVEAQVLVSVVDEAALAVWETPFDLLLDLFEPIWDANIRTFCSYTPRDNSGGGEGGGGGDDGLLRSDFRDNPAFLTLSTSSRGKAKATFELADSLTSWRVTTLAVTQDAAAGQDVQNIKAGLPFFIDVLGSDCYVEGDELAVSLRGFGEQLSENERVAFAAELIKEGATTGMTRSGSGVAGEYVTLSFGKQKQGRYRLHVSGKSASHTDAVELEFEVVGSALQTLVMKEQTIEALDTIAPLRYPVTLSICDRETAFYWSLLTDLAAGGGARAERRIAADRATALLLELAPELGDALPHGEPLFAMQDGICPLPTMSADVLLTAKAALVAPELVHDRLADYFWNVLYGEPTPDDAAAAYLGLAAMKQPVLRDIHTLLAWQPEENSGVQPLTDRQKLILVAALAAIGDDDGAKAAYDTWIRPQLVSLDGALYLDQDDAADRAENTALALLTASVTAKDDALAMVRYLRDNETAQVTTCLEQLFYAVRNKPAASNPLEVTVSMEGAEQTVSLGRRGIAALQLNRRQLESFALVEQKEEQAQPALSLFVCYLGSADQLSHQEQRLATLTKTITPVEGADISQSSLLRVTIEADFEETPEEGYYLINDVIPSGMRFANKPENYGGGDWNSRWAMLSQDGQQVSFGVWYGNDGVGGPEKALVYYVRAVLPGSFVSEAPVLTHESSGLWGTGEQDIVVIEK